MTPAWPNGDRWDVVAATSHRRQLSEDAAEKLQSFLGQGEVGAEAHFRLGVLLAVGLDRPAEALRHFARADDQSDAFIAYLARYYAGRVQEMAGAVEQAEVAYRAALAVQPRTPSASLSLAFLLLSSGRGTEASDVMARSLESPPEVDPFRVHGFADHRFIDALFIALRRELGS